MERVFVLMFVLALVAGLVCGLEDWEDINVEGGATDNEALDVGDATLEPVSYSDSGDVSQSTGDGKFFTAEFYMALVLGVIVLIIIGVIVWVLIRGPRNKWDK